MAPLKCCVGGCSATDESHQLFSMPKNDNLRKLWLSFILPTNPSLKKNTRETLIKRRVCAKHFDKYQFDFFGKRLRYSYPCLMTEKEITYGIPLTSGGKPESDHSYIKKEANDHDYIEHGNGQTQSEEKNPYHAERFNTPAGAWGYYEDDDDNDGNNIRFGLSLDSDETSQEENKNSLPTLYMNYTANTDNIEDNDANAELGSGGTSESALFSWNKKCDIVPEADNDDDIMYKVVEVTGDVINSEENMSRQPNVDKLKETKIPDAPGKSEHVGFRCDCCQNPIVGYRYTCLQCDDYDLCSKCESRQIHGLHYMLRIPGPRPYEEVQSMLQLIRTQLCQSEILLKSFDANQSIPFPEESIKLEAKDELEEVDPFESTTLHTSVSTLFETAYKLEDTGEENANETDAELANDLQSVNFANSTSRCNRRTYMQRKRRLHDYDASDVEFTADISSVNVPTKHTDSNEPAFLLEIKNTKDIDESDKECKLNLPSPNVAPKPNLSEEPTHIPYKRNVQIFYDSDEESTTNMPLDNVPIDLILSDEQTCIPTQMNTTLGTDKLKEECRIVLPLANVATKFTRSNRPIHIRNKRKHQIAVEEYIKDLPPENVMSSPTLRGLQHFPHKRKNKHQRTENYGIQQIDTINPKVVLSKLPLELVNKHNFITSDNLKANYATNVASTDNVKSDEKSGSMLFSPEHFGLSETDLKKMFNIDVKNRKQILIRIDKIR